MYTTHHPCWDAKNRYGLAEEVPFDYAEIAHIIEGIHKDTPSVQKTSVAVSTSRETEPDLADPIRGSSKSSKEKRETASEAALQEEEILLTIPKALRDLMIANRGGVWDIQNVVFARGYYPVDTPIEDYDPDFIHGVLVGAWSQVYAMIKEIREKERIPFN